MVSSTAATRTRAAQKIVERAEEMTEPALAFPTFDTLHLGTVPLFESRANLARLERERGRKAGRG